MNIELNATHETGFIGNGGLEYNIQIARASDGVWFQRHIWKNDGYSSYNPPRSEAWIKGIQSGPNAGMREIA